MVNVICCTAKNENLYLNDFCKWHIALGFDHIYVFDNNNVTSPDVRLTISDEIKDKITFFDVRGIHKHRFQNECYNKFYQEYKDTFDWCAFIDVDEFIQLKGFTNITDFLSQDKFNNFKAVRLKWELYGDNDMVTRDMSVPVYLAFTKPTYHGIYSFQSKTILRGHLDGIVWESSHWAKCGNTVVKQCLPDGRESKTLINETVITPQGAWINHYMTKTISEFLVQKFNRGDMQFVDRKIDTQYFFNINKRTSAKMTYVSNFQKKNSKNIYYWRDVKNVGDYVGPWLLERFGFTPVWSEKSPNCILCGSILGHCKGEIDVWGPGFHNETDKMTITNINKYHAVRGKLTYNKLKTTKPIVLGDTGLMVSYFFRPEVKKEYKIGFIPHWNDERSLPKIVREKCHIISMNNNDVEKTLTEINKCDFICSSSLHGIIFAHSYGIPAVHVELKELESKKNFKFKDYYSVFDDIQYEKISIKDFVNNIDWYIKYLPSAQGYVPDQLKVQQIQKDLLNSFPYK